MRHLNFLDAGARHFRLAIRTLLRNKGVYLSAAGTLALGIGMSVAMFSLVYVVLLRPLPFPKQESIQVIWKVDPLAGKHVEELANPELRDLQESIQDFEYVAVMPTSLYGYAKVLQKDGSERTRLVRDMVSGTLRFVFIGEVLGAAIVTALGKLYSGLLFGVSAGDPLLLGSVVAFLFVASSERLCLAGVVRRGWGFANLASRRL